MSQSTGNSGVRYICDATIQYDPDITRIVKLRVSDRVVLPPQACVTVSTQCSLQLSVIHFSVMLAPKTCWRDLFAFTGHVRGSGASNNPVCVHLRNSRNETITLHAGTHIGYLYIFPICDHQDEKDVDNNDDDDEDDDDDDDDDDDNDDEDDDSGVDETPY